MAKKISQERIKALQEQKVKKNKAVDAIDAGDRFFGRIISKIGKCFDPEDGKFWK